MTSSPAQKRASATASNCSDYREGTDREGTARICAEFLEVDDTKMLGDLEGRL